MLFSRLFSKAANPASGDPTDPRTAYAFSFHRLTGCGDLALSEYRGKVLLIVNTASQCGFTSQYAGLEKLYGAYRDRGLTVIGVPSNDFGAQEPGNAESISRFCAINYGVTFPMARKEAVKGPTAHPFYLWARDTLGTISKPRWNFHKYLVDRSGHLRSSFFSMTSPESERLIRKIEALLKEPPAA